MSVIDCIVEIHDARIPFTGRNPLFAKHSLIRPYILVLNKADLTDNKSMELVKDKYSRIGNEKVIYGNIRGMTNANSILNTIISTVEESSDRFNRQFEETINIAVIGVPNVGKSSLINLIRTESMRKGGKATKTGAQPGVTKKVLTRIKLNKDPPVYVFDTPGIMAPLAADGEAVCKLGLCAAILPHVIGEEYLVDYFLYWMNTHSRFEYVDYFGLDGPTDDVVQFLTEISNKNNKTMKRRLGGTITMKPDMLYAATQVFLALNKGKFGLINFDEDVTKSQSC